MIVVVVRWGLFVLLLWEMGMREESYAEGQEELGYMALSYVLEFNACVIASIVLRRHGARLVSVWLRCRQVWVVLVGPVWLEVG